MKSVIDMKKKIVKLLIILVAMVTTIFYIGPLVTTGEHSIGVLSGLGVAALLFLYVLFFDKINNGVKNFNSKKSGKIVTSLVCIVLALGIGVGGFAFGNVVAHSKSNEKNTEYVIVLGCMVRGDEPGIFLRGRINKAYEYLTNHPESKAILSGGQGNGENISEAQCMYNVLSEKGIEASRLIIEDKSTSTKENFENSLSLLKKSGVNIDEITVVTNDFHEYRAYEFAKRNGVRAYSYSSKTPWNGYMPFATREAIAVVYQIYIK